MIFSPPDSELRLFLASETRGRSYPNSGYHADLVDYKDGKEWIYRYLVSRTGDDAGWDVKLDAAGWRDVSKGRSEEPFISVPVQDMDPEEVAGYERAVKRRVND